MIVHVVGIEESHLLLNGAKDARITSMQTNDKVAFVVVLLHQGTLLFEVHVSRGTHNGPRLMTVRQGLGHQRACI